MAPTHRPLAEPTVLFAHRGASAHEPAGSPAAFSLALRLGATGVRSDLSVTADGVAVLTASTGRIRRRGVRTVTRSQLPPSVLTLEDLLGLCGPGTTVWLDVVDIEAIVPAVAVARAAGAADRLWLTWGDAAQLRALREDTALGTDGPRLLVRSRASALAHGLERTSAELRDAAIDGLVLPRDDWSAGRTTLLHRFGRLAVSDDAPHERMLVELLHMGIDGVSSAHADRLADAAAAVGVDGTT